MPKRPADPGAGGPRPVLSLRRSTAAPPAAALSDTRPPEDAGRRKPFRVCGLAAVRALFESDPDRVERLFYDDRSKALVGPFCAAMAERRRPYRLLPADEMEKVAGTVLHGGVVAVARPRPVLPFDEAACAAWAAAGEPLLLLDGVGNPHNLGAIVRTAAFFGLPRIVLSDHPGQALPSESAYRVAEGGFEHVALYRADRFADRLARIGAHYRTVATALGGHAPLDGLSGGARPVALVLGNEEDGLPPATLAACAQVLTIPGSGRIQSLNVAATAAILAYLLSRA